MAFNLNDCTFAGHLTRDPVVRTFGDRKTVANFAIAINRRFKTADGQAKEEVTYINCVAWNRLAELVGQYLGKGSAVYVQGQMINDDYEDGEGKKHPKMRLRVTEVHFLDRKRSENGAPAAPVPGAAAVPPSTSPVMARSDDEPPF